MGEVRPGLNDGLTFIITAGIVIVLYVLIRYFQHKR